MKDTELDALLAPPALAQPAALDGDLAALVLDARRTAQRQRRTPRFIAAGAALTLVLGGGTAAAASIGVFEWEPWASTSRGWYQRARQQLREALAPEQAR